MRLSKVPNFSNVTVVDIGLKFSVKRPQAPCPHVWRVSTNFLCTEESRFFFIKSSQSPFDALVNLYSVMIHNIYRLRLHLSTSSIHVLRKFSWNFSLPSDVSLTEDFGFMRNYVKLGFLNWILGLGVSWKISTLMIHYWNLFLFSMFINLVFRLPVI